MTTIASIRHSERGICAKCGYALFVPEWSEYVSEQLVLNLWSCTKCGYRFETEARMPADAESIDNAETIEAFFSVTVGSVNSWDRRRMVKLLVRGSCLFDREIDLR